MDKVTSKEDVFALLLKELVESNRQNSKMLEALVTSMRPTRAMDPSLTEHERKEARNAEAHGAGVPLIPIELVKCKSDETGATFVAEVQKGKVFTLREYQYPEGADVNQAQGGLAPHSKEIRDEHGQLSPYHKNWCYDAFRAVDIKRFVGKPLPAHVRVKEEGGA